MSRKLPIFLLACMVSWAMLASADTDPMEPMSAWGDQMNRMVASSYNSTEPMVCFIVRTYYAHGYYGSHQLKHLLKSFQKQEHQRWEALLLVLDNRPFPDLRSIVRDTKDERIWVFAEWVAYKYAPKQESGVWADGYHKKLYHLTDEAIRACPRDTDWVVITNGDNDYDPKFLTELLKAPQDADAVVFDFYSRYQRPTATPCERFAASPGLPPCKVNEMRFCHTDLSADAYKYKRLMAEDRRFGALEHQGTAAANDGIMAHTLLKEGWKMVRVNNKCLVDHSPSPQRCAAVHMYWDDSLINHHEHHGGACISKAAAEQKLATEPGKYEFVSLNITYDRDSFGFQGNEFLELHCLRMANPAEWSNAHMYGKPCAATIDIPSLPADLPPHPWAAYYDETNKLIRELY